MLSIVVLLKTPFGLIILWGLFWCLLSLAICFFARCPVLPLYLPSILSQQSNHKVLLNLNWEMEEMHFWVGCRRRRFFFTITTPRKPWVNRTLDFKPQTLVFVSIWLQHCSSEWINVHPVAECMMMLCWDSLIPRSRFGTKWSRK